MSLQKLAVDGVEVARDMIEQLVTTVQHISEADIDWKRTLKLLA